MSPWVWETQSVNRATLTQTSQATEIERPSQAQSWAGTSLLSSFPLIIHLPVPIMT